MLGNLFSTIRSPDRGRKEIPSKAKAFEGKMNMMALDKPEGIKAKSFLTEYPLHLS
jgi:hypothetical protein